MPSPTFISITALVVSIAGFALSSYLAWRDRANVQATSDVHVHDRTGEFSSISIYITNSGRRPVNIIYLWGKYEDKSEGGIRLAEIGKKLNEGDIYELEFGKFDRMMVSGDDLSGLVDIFIKDSAGRRYKVKDSKRNIALLKVSKHPFGVRTHG